MKPGKAITDTEEGLVVFEMVDANGHVIGYQLFDGGSPYGATSQTPEAPVSAWRQIVESRRQRSSFTLR